MKRIVVVAALAFATPAAAETVVVTADRMIDVLGGKVVERPVVTITDGRITAVTSGTAPAAPPNARRVDLPGKTLLPGLIDMHVHLDSPADIGGYRGLEFTDSFWAMVEYGMTPMQVIQAATRNAAQALGRERDVGAIAVGRFGDLIAVDGDPLADVRALESVDVVIKGGAVVKREAAAVG